MKKSSVLYSLIILVICSFSYACNSNEVVYTGKKIKLDFQGVRTIEDLSWIEIDGIRYTHHSNRDRLEEQLALPASKLTYFIGEQEKFEPMNPYTIALVLGRKIDFKSMENDLETARIKEEERYLLDISGIIMLINQKGKDVSVKVPKGYPVKIEVLEV